MKKAKTTAPINEYVPTFKSNSTIAFRQYKTKTIDHFCFLKNQFRLVGIAAFCTLIGKMKSKFSIPCHYVIIRKLRLSSHDWKIFDGKFVKIT